MAIAFFWCASIPVRSDQADRVLSKENSQAAARRFPEIKAKAEAGEPQAQYVLGLMYFFGLGVSRDEGDAGETVKWIRKSAEQGYAPAQVKLGTMYMFSKELLPMDNAEAAKWFQKAAEQNDPEGQRLLAQWGYAGGVITSKNETEALKWYRKAAEQGDIEAQSELAGMYYDGHGVTKDMAEALKWRKKAADQGKKFHQWLVARMYARGEGGAKNDGEAVKWLHRAAEQGYDQAQANLAFMYMKGQGVPQDFVESYKWANVAAAQRDEILDKFSDFARERQKTKEEYAKFRDDLAEIMTKEQIAEGQRRSSLFVAKEERQPRERLWDAIDFLSKTPKWEDTTEIPTTHTQDAKVLMPEVAKPKSSGTGFFITTDGYLLTSWHVVADARAISVKTKRGYILGKLVKTDAVNDVALLKVPPDSLFTRYMRDDPTVKFIPGQGLIEQEKVSGSFHPLPIAASHTVKLGDSVLTIGFPNTTLQGVEPKLTRGEINSLAGLRDDPRQFQISVAVQPGNSGGPLVDSSGNVVGIVTARLSEGAALRETGALPQAVNYALKSSFVIAFLESTPEVMAKLAKPDASKRSSEDVVKGVQEASVLVLVY